MKLIVGLGNPGGQYARNRHNIGFLAVEAIAEARGFGPWRSKFQGLISEGRLGSEKALLLKPETFMNLSGDSVRAAMAFYKLAPADVLVLHDELDLAPGKLRFKTGGGHAGHNGLRSIDAHIGAAFQRVRMGIGHPGDKRLVSNYVLGDFAKADEAWLDPLLAAVAAEAPLLATDGARFLTAVAQRLAPPKPKPEAAGKPEAAPPAPKTPTPDGGTAGESDGPMDALRRLADRFR
ncbi:MAG: aminoacyl-tRNA hydrolase [Rhodovulum sulfidophilum]|uniref:Peptidyl-tRNA hydrolase n=1 Tax=Rhodovulum sulfidophilum TaxID=35806 RepID=A0A2W5NDD7_RHOSU|nr:MAG: aminoacyl-tRNA hydrolase [Rhodovulum sulfidophilum]